MYPPCSKPMEAARGGGPLVQQYRRPGSSRARAGTLGHGAGAAGYYSTPSAARRGRLLVLVASPRVREPLPAQSLGEEEPVAVEVDEDADDDSAAGILLSPDVPAETKTVRVKFVLEKNCAFGEQFLVVGDDPALGIWDPAKATALDWSEGHVWTVKTDLPANKLIEFKFLLRDASGHVRWQQGPNRTLQTTETPNTLVVHEDWDHATEQRVSEEAELPTTAEEEDVMFSDDLAASTAAMPADELVTGGNLESNGSEVLADAPPNGEMVKATMANGENQTQFILENDQEVLNELHGEADTVPQNGYYPSDNGDAALKNEDDTAVCQEDAQIEKRSTSIFANDLAWIRKALQQLLRFLGFQVGTTRT